jgi:Ni,Fe-hydrogenase I cytochrome b subunit
MKRCCVVLIATRFYITKSVQQTDINSSSSSTFVSGSFSSSNSSSSFAAAALVDTRFKNARLARVTRRRASPQSLRLRLDRSLQTCCS